MALTGHLQGQPPLKETSYGLFKVFQSLELNRIVNRQDI
jgi:hypothetical protein